MVESVFMLTHVYANVYIVLGVPCMLADSSDVGLLGQQNSPR